jgi:protease-4
MNPFDPSNPPSPPSGEPAPVPQPVPPTGLPDLGPIPPLGGRPAASTPAPPRPVPPPPPPRVPPRSAALGCLFALSVLLNIAALAVIIVGCFGAMSRSFSPFSTDASGETLNEKPFSGKDKGKDKVAIITLDGVIMEGQLDFMRRQIDQAAKDANVKAVVLRINSPGGSVTASDELHRRLTRLAGGNSAEGHPARPLIVSMGSMAASGGYYVAMPGQTIFCERTGVTGSIGVYAAFPNVSGLAKKYEVDMIVIKQGEIKDSGSPFKPMSDKEKAVWQDMVDHAYRQFVQVVEQGRPQLKGKMLEKFTIKPRGPDDREEKDEKKWLQRYRADGGIYTSDEAVRLGLIDREGSLDDAVKAALEAANLPADGRVIQYEKPKTLTDMLLGIKAPQPPALLDADKLKKGLVPRVWFLAPGCELAGLAAAIDD